MILPQVRITHTKPYVKDRRAPLDTTQNEIRRLANSVAASCDKSVVKLACMSHLVQTLLLKHARESGAPTDSFSKMFVECTSAYIEQNNIDRSAVDGAMLAIQRAEATMAYLDSLPP